MWIIVIIVFLALCAIFSWLSPVVNGSADTFNGNIFNILALISAVISVIYFWASSKSYKDYKIKDKIMKLFEGSNNLPDKKEKEIDLSTIDLNGLVAELQRVLTSPAPIFFKGWGNMRLQLDVDRVGLLNDYIQNVMAAGQSFVRLKADAVISYKKIQLLAEKELWELKREADGAEFDFKLLNDRFEFQITQLRTDKENMLLEVEKRKAEIRLLNAQAAQAEAVARQESEKANGLAVKVKESGIIVEIQRVALKEIKFSELPKSFQTYIITIILKKELSDANKLNDFEMADLLKEWVVKQAKAETDKKEAEAGGIRADTELKFMKNKEAKKKLGL